MISLSLSLLPSWNLLPGIHVTPTRAVLFVSIRRPPKHLAVKPVDRFNSSRLTSSSLFPFIKPVVGAP